MPAVSTERPHDPKCAFCGRAPTTYAPVRDDSVFDVDCAMCGRYRISRDREVRMLRKEFTRRARAAQLAEIHSANAAGLRYSVDDGRPVKMMRG